jgi:hypothetical protein
LPNRPAMVLSQPHETTGVAGGGHTTFSTFAVLAVLNKIKHNSR